MNDTSFRALGFEDRGYYANVILDSRCEATGARVTTMECRYPRFIHSEMLTHRAFARNSASSRAIPLKKMLQQIMDDPVIPIRWGSEQKGMKTGDELETPVRVQCEREWLYARDMAVEQARRLAQLGLHKSLCNRVVEPWMWIIVIITATDWLNFFRQRCHEDAEVHMQKIAYLMRSAMQASIPQVLQPGQWHLPLVTGYDEEELRAMFLDEWIPGNHSDEKRDEWLINHLCSISTARVARVSYLTHDGVKDWRKDLELADKLRNGSGFGHWSPTEHPCRVEDRLVRSGPFQGFTQFRKLFPNENGD